MISEDISIENTPSDRTMHCAIEEFNTLYTVCQWNFSMAWITTRFQNHSIYFFHFCSIENRMDGICNSKMINDHDSRPVCTSNVLSPIFLILLNFPLMIAYNPRSEKFRIKKKKVVVWGWPCHHTDVIKDIWTVSINYLDFIFKCLRQNITRYYCNTCDIIKWTSDQL